MLRTFLSSLRSSASNDRAYEPRRRHVRRHADRCVAVIYGQTFPVQNWSFGGLLLGGDDRMFGLGQDLPVTLKFRLHNAILDIDLRGRVMRKGNLLIGIRFEPFGHTVKRAFQQVVDDAVAAEFADSQAT